MTGEHVQRRVAYYEATESRKKPGYVAWCSCGVGSPLKTTRAKAEASLALHVYRPREMPQ